MLFSVIAAMPEALCAQEASPRRIYPATELVRAGKPAALVVYPSGTNGYRELAAKVVAAVKARTGLELQMLPDTEVTQTNYPVLLDAYRGRNLVLLGRLGINRALWGVYNRFLCAEDGYYPGGDGYVVRTAANVYKNGANTIVAGGSSDAGAARAVEKLAERIAAQPYKDGNLVLPWLLDVELGGECKKAFDNDEQRQMARIFPGAPGEDPHSCHPVKRFSENIMSWYWSGRESYLKLGLRFRDLLLAEDSKITDVKKRGITGHYAAEFFVRAYDMIDDSGRLSAEQIKTTDQAIVNGFYNIFGYDERESTYRLSLKKDNGKDDEVRPADEIYTESHGNCLWLADKIYADFILGAIPETPETVAIHKEARVRRSLYVKAFDALVGDRWREDANDTTPMMTLFRYALEMERYDLFFDSGNARKAVLYKLARVANPSQLDIGLLRDDTCRQMDYGIYAGVVALHDGDGELKQVIETMPGMAAGFYGQYVNGVHRYSPGPELKSVPPKSLTGAASVPLQPVHYRRMQCALPYEQTYNFATIRNGFGNEDYLLMCGGQDLPGNTLVRLASQGTIWLSHTADKKMFNQNALYIRRLSALNLDKQPVPPASRLDHIATASAALLISSTLPGYAGADWRRQIVCLPGQFFAVLDTVTAREPDRYLVMANWRPNLYAATGEMLGPAEGGGGRLEGNRWVVRGSGQEFMIAFAGNKIQPIEDADFNPVTRISIPVYRQRLAADLKKGESVSLANLMFARAAGSNTDYELRQTGDGGLLVRAADAPDRIYYIGALPAALGKSDAPLVVLTTNRLTAFNAGTLEIRGKAWAENEPAKTREIDIGDAEARDALQELWSSGGASAPAPAAAQAIKMSGKDSLVREWRYAGARQPGLIAGVQLAGSNTWDLGYVADLAQICVTRMGMNDISWADYARGLRCSDTGIAHTQIWISAEGQAETFKQFRGDLVDIAVPTMGGYGRITKQEKVYQALRGEPQKARYVKVAANEKLPSKYYLFYDAGRPDEREPLRARVVALRDKDKPDILVYPDIWPGFRNVARLTHSIFALDPEGNARWGHEMKWRIFFVRALDWEGTGLKKIFVGSLDNNVYVYDGAGKLTDTLTVDNSGGILSGGYGGQYGFPLASSIGLWQRDAAGRRKLVLPRYHHMSFLERDGRVEGHASPAARCPYWITDVLEAGVDFTGDGVEDSVAMSTSEILPLTQGVITGGRYPALELPNDHADDGLLSGAPTLAFHLYGTGTNLFVARHSMIGLYDLKNRKWLMSWAPETSITAAVALPEHRQILCYTREGMLWRIKLGADFAVAGVETAPVSMAFNRFAVLDSRLGAVAAASPAGLFRIGMDNAPVLLAPGSFVDVDTYPSAAAPEKIIAVDKAGAVEAYRLKLP